MIRKPRKGKIEKIGKIDRFQRKPEFKIDSRINFRYKNKECKSRNLYFDRYTNEKYLYPYYRKIHRSMERD